MRTVTEGRAGSRRAMPRPSGRRARQVAADPVADPRSRIPRSAPWPRPAAHGSSHVAPNAPSWSQPATSHSAPEGEIFGDGGRRGRDDRPVVHHAEIIASKATPPTASKDRDLDRPPTGRPPGPDRAPSTLSAAGLRTPSRGSIERERASAPPNRSLRPCASEPGPARRRRIKKQNGQFDRRKGQLRPAGHRPEAATCAVRPP